MAIGLWRAWNFFLWALPALAVATVIAGAGIIAALVLAGPREQTQTKAPPPR